MSSIGTDIEQISRVEAALARTPRLALRLFTDGGTRLLRRPGAPGAALCRAFLRQRSLCQGDRRAARLAGSGSGAREDGPPTIITHGEAAHLLAGRPVRLSLSHAGDYAMAMVLIED